MRFAGTPASCFSTSITVARLYLVCVVSLPSCNSTVQVCLYSTTCMLSPLASFLPFTCCLALLVAYTSHRSLSPSLSGMGTSRKNCNGLFLPLFTGFGAASTLPQVCTRSPSFVLEVLSMVWVYSFPVYLFVSVLAVLLASRGVQDQEPYTR